jgi:hypothetical protein
MSPVPPVWFDPDPSHGAEVVAPIRGHLAHPFCISLCSSVEADARPKSVLLSASGGRQAEFRILGPLQVWDEGGEGSLGGRKPRALLAVLVHPNEVVPADRLIDERSDKDSPDRAAAALRINALLLGRQRSKISTSRPSRPVAAVMAGDDQPVRASPESQRCP